MCARNQLLTYTCMSAASVYAAFSSFFFLLTIVNTDVSLYAIGCERVNVDCPRPPLFCGQTILYATTVHILGSVPTFVRSWKAANCGKGLD